MSKITEQFIRKIPKTDLHLHLDGSLRLPTLIEMARAENVKLPSYEEEGLNEERIIDNFALGITHFLIENDLLKK